MRFFELWTTKVADVPIWSRWHLLAFTFFPAFQIELLQAEVKGAFFRRVALSQEIKGQGRRRAIALEDAS